MFMDDYVVVVMTQENIQSSSKFFKFESYVVQRDLRENIFMSTMYLKIRLF